MSNEVQSYSFTLLHMQLSVRFPTPGSSYAHPPSFFYHKL